jgi:hypothetical protein
MRAYYIEVGVIELGPRYAIVAEISGDSEEYRASVVDADWSTYYVSNHYTDVLDAVADCLEWLFSKDSDIQLSHLWNNNTSTL